MKLKEMVAPAKRVQSAKKMFSATKDAGVIDKLKPSRNGDDDDGQEGVGDGRRMPIQQSVDVAVPVETAWKLWNKYEDYPKFMHRLESAEKIDPKHVQFTGKIWGIRRNWEAEITEKRTHEAIAWTSEEGLENAGVVTFHKLSPRLTRISSVSTSPRTVRSRRSAAGCGSPSGRSAPTFTASRPTRKWMTRR